jgi:hypothetical protein
LHPHGLLYWIDPANDGGPLRIIFDASWPRAASKGGQNRHLVTDRFAHTSPAILPTRQCREWDRVGIAPIVDSAVFTHERAQCPLYACYACHACWWRYVPIGDETERQRVEIKAVASHNVVFGVAEAVRLGPSGPALVYHDRAYKLV